MKKMSMFQVILLCVFGASAVAGVMIFALAIGGNESSAIGAVRIWGTVDKTEFIEALQAAQDANQALLQVTYEQKDADTYMTELTDALASGKGPDMFLLRQDYAYSQKSRVIEIPFTELSASDFESRFVDAASPFLMPTGILGIPFLIDPLVLYWNIDTLNSGGYSQAPKHWDELYEMAQTITRRTDTGTITKSTIPFGQYKNVNHAKEILSALILQAGGTIVVRDDEGAVQPALAPASGAAAQASIAALSFFTEFADPSKQDYSWNASMPIARTAFTSGDVALYVGLASEAQLIAQANPNLNFAVAPIPQRRNANTSVNTGYTYAFAIPRTSLNPVGALNVARLLGGTENGMAFAARLGIPSARRDVLAIKTSTGLDVFNKEAIIVRSWIDPEPVQTGEIFRAMIEDTVNGALLRTEAVARADRQMAVILDKLQKNEQ